MAAVALYLPTVGFGFTGWDDTGYVLHNPNVTEPWGLVRNWTSAASDVYYPLMYSSYWLEYRLWGANPAGYHATNAVLHGVNAVLVLLFLLAMRATLRAAGLAAALFALHPLQVMTVAWIAERKNLLALLFTLLTLLAWSRERRVLAALAFAAALTSKTVVLGLPVALLAYDVGVRRRHARGSLPMVASLLLMSVAAAMVTIVFERPFVDRGASGLTPGVVERLQIAGAAPWFYLGKVLLPIGLSPAYPRWHVSVGNVLWWLPLLATIAVVVAGVLLLPRLRSRQERLAVWLLALAAILLAPSLGIVPFANLALTPVSDHFLYVPSAGIFGALALLITARRALLIPALAACVACAAATVAYQPVFRDAESLWSRVLALDPGSYAGNLGLAEVRAEAGRFEEALPHYMRAIEREPLAADAYLLLGGRQNARGDAASAAPNFARALELSPGNLSALLGLASAREGLGEVDEALALFERAARQAPHDLRARMELGRMYLAFARPAEALGEFRAALQIAPATPRAFLGTATCLRSLGRYVDAVAELHAGLARFPDDVPLLNLLALTLATAPDAQVRNAAEAVRLAERASALGPPGSTELGATLETAREAAAKER